MGIIATAIKEKLTQKYTPTQLEVIDESAKHAGHAGAAAHKEAGGSAESHFHVKIKSKAFEGMSRLSRHRAVIETLGETVEQIHAISFEIEAD
jgi:BolA protein